VVIKAEKRDWIVSIRTYRSLMEQARMLKINVSETLHKALESVVLDELKRRAESGGRAA